MSSPSKMCDAKQDAGVEICGDGADALGDNGGIVNDSFNSDGGNDDTYDAFESTEVRVAASNFKCDNEECCVNNSSGTEDSPTLVEYGRKESGDGSGGGELLYKANRATIARMSQSKLFSSSLMPSKVQEETPSVKDARILPITSTPILHFRNYVSLNNNRNKVDKAKNYSRIRKVNRKTATATGTGTGKSNRSISGNEMKQNAKRFKMNYIMLAGYLCGFALSIFFMIFFNGVNGMKELCLNLGDYTLGSSNFWKFFNYKDNTRFSVQSKLLLTPLVLIGGLLYELVNILGVCGEFLLKDVPRDVVELLQ